MMNKRNLLLGGVALWVLGAVIMHFVGPLVFNGGLLHIIFWISNFLAPVSVLPLIAKRLGRTKHQMFAPTAVMLLPVMMLDGLAITSDTFGWTQIYAGDPTLAGLTGGFLLFASGSFFFWALVWHRD